MPADSRRAEQTRKRRAPHRRQAARPLGLFVLSALLLAANGCGATPKADSADDVCFVIAEPPPVTPEWVDGAEEAWIDWLVPIVDYGQRHCGWERTLDLPPSPQPDRHGHCARAGSTLGNGASPPAHTPSSCTRTAS
jgi:hypothetical protein